MTTSHRRRRLRLSMRCPKLRFFWKSDIGGVSFTAAYLGFLFRQGRAGWRDIINNGTVSKNSDGSDSFRGTSTFPAWVKKHRDYSKPCRYQPCWIYRINDIWGTFGINGLSHHRNDALILTKRHRPFMAVSNYKTGHQGSTEYLTATTILRLFLGYWLVFLTRQLHITQDIHLSSLSFWWPISKSDYSYTFSDLW